MGDFRARRDFLSPAQRPAESPPAATPIVCLTREAMACLFEIQFPEGGLARSVAIRAFDRIDAVERQLTVYRADSEVSQINQSPLDSPVPVESGLFDLLVDCHRLSEETGGAFDITAGPLIRVWGFKRREGRVPTPQEIEAARQAVGSRHLQLDLKAKTIARRRENMEINFGGIGKGYALDRVADDLLQTGATSFLLGAGQSSIRAYGSRPGESGWPIDLAHPQRPGEQLGRIRLNNASLSTSGTAEQSFVHEGKRYSHLIDPRTGWPARGMRQVAVVAPTAAWAEALSTAFFVLGTRWAQEYCERSPDVGAVLLADSEADDSTSPPVVTGSIDFEPASTKAR